jgi:hypothetical protein
MQQHHRITIPESVVYKNVGGEVVLLDFDHGVYYGLNEVGSRLWELLAAGKTVDQAIDVLFDEYQVTREDLTEDVEAILADLKLNGLVSE